jgi:5-methyltetrahydropteroyltriglutamate--homocysteine methyltransferase
MNEHKQPPFRAEHIGSLVRPSELLAARRALEAGEIGGKKLAEIEDKAIRAVVKLQEDAGLKVVTDGEFRRTTYSDAFTTAGISGVHMKLTEPEGWAASATHGHRTAQRVPAVVDRIQWTGAGNANDFAFLASCTSVTPKITLPGPAYIHYRAGRANISRDVYPDLDAFWSDLVAAYHREIASLHAAGCRYLQIDETSLVKLGDERARALLAARGDDWRDLLRVYIEAVNAVVAGAPKDMTIGVHVCRSQNPSWQADIGYDPIARELFNDMRVDNYFLEYDNARAGGFEPLALVPKGKHVVLGLMSSKTTDIESAELLEKRIEEATKFIDLDQLSLSPQCGFSTSVVLRIAMTETIQAAKLKRVVEVAQKVWGE